MFVFWVVFVSAVLWLIMSFGAGWAAAERGRSGAGGCLLTLILGPLGLAIVLLMPYQDWEEEE